MDVIDAIKKRRSIRRFKSTPVPDEIIKKILEAGRLAPSWGNVQPWRFIVVKDPETKSKIAKFVRQRQVERAPVVIVCCADLHAWNDFAKRIEELNPGRPEVAEKTANDPWLNPTLISKEMVLKRSVEQIPYAIENMVLAAVNEGLGSCIVGGRLLLPELEKLLKIPDHVVITNLLTLGYPDEDPDPRPRIELEDLVFEEEWGRKWKV